MTRVLIFGTGSIGIMCAMILHRAGIKVTCVCRSNYAEVKQRGFTVESTIFGKETFRTSIVRLVSEAINDDQSFDFVIVATKSLPNTSDAIISAISPAMKDKKTALVLIQNGIGIEEVYHKAFPGNVILSAVVYMPTVEREPGVVFHQEIEIIHVGTYPSQSDASARELADKFVQVVTKGGGTAVAHEDVQAERWKKLVANAAWNSVCALTRCTDLQFLKTSDYSRGFVRDAMVEVVEVAAAMGYEGHVSLDTVQMHMNRAESRSSPGVRPSMMMDMSMGRRMEVQTVIGEVVRLGHKYKVSIPRLEALHVLLVGLDWALDEATSK
ncbi:2-dehydropantoate 2-reductase [Trichoderma sp. SZMC 28015]